MHITFLCSNYPPEAHGGTEQVVAALAGEHRRAGLDVSVVCSSDRVHFGVDWQLESWQQVPVHRLWKQLGEWDQDGLQRPRLLNLLRDRLAELRPDLVHVHSFAALGPGCLQVCSELGLPILLTCHDLWVTCPRYFRLPRPGLVCPSGADRSSCIPCIAGTIGQPEALVQPLLAERDRLLRAELARVAVCTAPSAAAARFVRECLPYPGPIDVIPHGLLRPVATSARSRPPASGERLRVGTFGNLVPEKGVADLVAAVAGLPVELVLAGKFLDPDFAAAMREAAAAQGTPLRETGPYDQDQQHPATQLHLAVFPSHCQETYGLVVDEALAHGLPVVLSDVGAFAERRNGPGVLVTSHAMLPGLLRQLVQQPEQLAALRAAVPAVLPGIDSAAARYRLHYSKLS